MLRLLGLLAIVCLPHVAAQCSWVSLSGSQYNNENEINGHYELLSGQSCDDLDAHDNTGKNVWIQRNGSSSYTNYIFYDDDWYTWVVAPYKCQDGPMFSAKASTLYTNYPYDVPKGSWEEWNPLNNSYTSSPNMGIYCASNDDGGGGGGGDDDNDGDDDDDNDDTDDDNDDLTGWEIFGIVIGCLCGAALIAVLVWFLYAHNKQKKKDPPPSQNTAAAAASTTAASWAATGNVATAANYYTQDNNNYDVDGYLVPGSRPHNNTYEYIRPQQFSVHPAIGAPPPPNAPPPPYESKDTYGTHVV